jgi:hypothetical protein
MHTDITTFDMGVLHPAWKFTADLENGPGPDTNTKGVQQSKIQTKRIPSERMFILEKKKCRGWPIVCTCREVTGGERTHDVHHAKRDHLLVTVDLLVLDHRQASSDGYSLLRRMNT